MVPRARGTISALREAALGTPGALSRTVREAIFGRSARFGGASGDGEPPAELAAFVEKMARHAYEVDDADIAALRRAGHSEDAIFEAMVAAAVGAGIARLDRGLAALDEGGMRNAAQER
jgi:alkylhydroperoxidase family enzyme